MKILIINTDRDENASSHMVTFTDNAIRLQLYYKYSSLMGISANHSWDKYTFIDEKAGYIDTFKTMDRLQKENPFLGNVLIVTHEQWLDKQESNWRDNSRYY